MVLQKKSIVRIFFSIEILLFVWMYFASSEGLPTVWAMQKENQQLAQSVIILEGEVGKLEQECYNWQSKPFYKEKLARERLQMARPDDEVYFVV